MAGLWQRTGTVTVTNGSKKVTGFGSQWKSTVYKPDKGHAFYGPDGKAYEIDYVESDTVLYLVLAYAGATSATQPYAIDITRTSTVPAFSRELSAQLAYAQAQYDSWQQVLTGSGTVTLTAPDGQQIQVPALSAFQPTSASLKALEGLTPAADKIAVFNGPTGAELITLTAFIRTLLDDVDAATALGTLDIADLYKKRNIIGAVSQSSGVPTGAIIERGSNANGTYTKFAGGLMICDFLADFGTTVTTLIGNVYKGPGYKWTFPASFAGGSVPSCTGKARNWSSTWLAYETTVIDDNTSAGFCLYAPGQITGSTLLVTLSAIGRWH